MTRNKAEKVASTILAFLSKFEIGDHDPYKLKAMVKSIKKFDVTWVNTNSAFFVDGHNYDEVRRASERLLRVATKLYDDVEAFRFRGKEVWDISLRGENPHWRAGVRFIGYDHHPKDVDMRPDTLRRSKDPYA